MDKPKLFKVGASKKFGFCSTPEMRSVPIEQMTDFVTGCTSLHATMSLLYGMLIILKSCTRGSLGINCSLCLQFLVQSPV